MPEMDKRHHSSDTDLPDRIGLSHRQYEQLFKLWRINRGPTEVELTQHVNRIDRHLANLAVAAGRLTLSANEQVAFERAEAVLRLVREGVGLRGLREVLPWLPIPTTGGANRGLEAVGDLLYATDRYVNGRRGRRTDEEFALDYGPDVAERTLVEETPPETYDPGWLVVEYPAAFDRLRNNLPQSVEARLL